MSIQRATRAMLLCSLFSLSSVALAANPASTQPTNMNSDAIAFAVQAGAIAGTAQACGQDISVFTTRVGEALNKLAVNNSDKLMAITEFQKSLQQAQINEGNNHPIPCSQVAQDYNSLPLLRPDYEQTVISQLSASGTMTNKPSSPNALTNQQITNSVGNPNLGTPNSMQPGANTTTNQLMNNNVNANTTYNNNPRASGIVPSVPPHPTPGSPPPPPAAYNNPAPANYGTGTVAPPTPPPVPPQYTPPANYQPPQYTAPASAEQAAPYGTAPAAASK